jgi:ribose transport system permease protein
VSASATPASPRLPTRAGRGISFKPSQEQIVLLITLFFLAAFGLALPGFATVPNLLNLMRSISILGILSLGMGMIVISRGIDLSEVAIWRAPGLSR